MRTLFSHKSSVVLLSLLVVVFGGISGCSKPSTQTISFQTESKSDRERTININRATAEELEELPHLGAVLAKRIIEHRERYGPFRRSEHILAVEGISEKRYRELKQFIDTK
jgi:competence protein ComEA